MSNTLLTGNFVRDGDNFRITPQLIDVRTRKVLWRGTIDLKYDHLLNVQDNVAQQIVKGLELSLSPSQAEKLKTDEPVDPVAYEYYLRGVDLYSQNDFPLSIKMLEKSAQIEPNYALTWAHLGKSYAALRRLCNSEGVSNTTKRKPLTKRPSPSSPARSKRISTWPTC